MSNTVFIVGVLLLCETQTSHPWWVMLSLVLIGLLADIMPLFKGKADSKMFQEIVKNWER